ELGAEHEWQPVLHRHRRRVPVARRQAHGLRPRDRRHGRRRRDLGARHRRAGPPERRRRHRARRASRSISHERSAKPYQSAANTSPMLAPVAMPAAFPNRNELTTISAATIATARKKNPAIESVFPSSTMRPLSSTRKRRRWNDGVAISSADD